MREVVQLLAIPLLAVAMVLRGTERRTIRRLRKAEATSPETAIELPPARRLGRWQLARIGRAGALVRTEDDRWYFAEKGYSAFRRARRKRALVVVPTLFGVVLVAFLLGGLAEGEVGESVCRGTTADGSLERGCRMPSSGDNVSAYSLLGRLAQRTWVHCTVASIVESAYAEMARERPETRFVYGETGWPSGGRFRPHKTHRNGLSVDFMVPVLDAEGRSVPLPTHMFNKWGYGLELDGEGRLPGSDLRIDFEALAAHLAALDRAARRHGVGLARVIFDPELQPFLHGTEAWPALRGRVAFSTRRSWVRHDEHNHVDFAVPCEGLESKATLPRVRFSAILSP